MGSCVYGVPPPDGKEADSIWYPDVWRWRQDIRIFRHADSWLNFYLPYRHLETHRLGWEGEERLKEYLVWSSHFTCQINGSGNAKGLSNLASEKVETATLGQCPLASSFLSRCGRGIGADRSWPQWFYTLITAPAGDVETLEFVHAGPWLLPAAAEISVKGFSWPQRCCTFPRRPRAWDWKLGNLLALLTGSRRTSLGHSCEVSEMTLALPAASRVRAFWGMSPLVEGSSQVNSLQPYCSSTSMAQQQHLWAC